MNEKGQTAVFVLIGFVAFVFLIGLFFVFPIYNIWQQEQAGKARLAEAQWSKQIAVEEAKAKLESEGLNAQAEVARARGVAESNEIIKNSINDQYIRYLWVKTLDGADKQIIYVPTESNLPLTEASRLAPQPTQPQQ